MTRHFSWDKEFTACRIEICRLGRNDHIIYDKNEFESKGNRCKICTKNFNINKEVMPSAAQ